MSERVSVFIGWDPREADAFAVARNSAQRRTRMPVPIRGVVLDDLRAKGLYTRPTSRRDGRLWDDISDAPMSTEFAISRFLVPKLAEEGWALFMDSDMLVRTDLSKLFFQADASKAVMVVKHHHEPPEGVKMDGQVQLRYARKNWSSVMLLNASHPANKALTVELINTVPGRDLHRFCWLDDSEIGELNPAWNYLVGHSDPSINPNIVHFTEGTPAMPGYEDCEYADEWRAELMRWAA
jgi:lipopolysaccharide biosynthesis glycosyltransferase